jgi:hypothetical protein
MRANARGMLARALSMELEAVASAFPAAAVGSLPEGVEEELHAVHGHCSKVGWHDVLVMMQHQHQPVGGTNMDEARPQTPRPFGPRGPDSSMQRNQTTNQTHTNAHQSQ